jgi:hypothetical protein
MYNRGSSFDPTNSKSAPGDDDDDDVWDCHIGEVNHHYSSYGEPSTTRARVMNEESIVPTTETAQMSTPPTKWHNKTPIVEEHAQAIHIEDVEAEPDCEIRDYDTVSENVSFKEESPEWDSMDIQLRIDPTGQADPVITRREKTENATTPEEEYALGSLDKILQDNSTFDIDNENDITTQEQFSAVFQSNEQPQYIEPTQEYAESTEPIRIYIEEEPTSYMEL